MDGLCGMAYDLTICERNSPVILPIAHSFRGVINHPTPWKSEAVPAE